MAYKDHLFKLVQLVNLLLIIFESRKFTHNVEYKSSVYKDLKKIDKKMVARILDQLEEKLSKDPNCGAPLKGQYKGMYKLRIGDYRVLYVKTKEGALILRIYHRGKGYKKRK